MEVDQSSASGTTDTTPVEQSSEKQDKVAYETYKKTVEAEKNAKAKVKSLADELESLKKQLDAKQESELKEKENYKALWENTNKTLEQTKKEKDDLIQSQLLAKRLNVFDEKVGRLKHQDFYRLIPVDKIQLDDSGNVIQESVDLVAKEVRERYGDDIFEKKQLGKLPASAGGNPSFERDLSKMGASDRDDIFKNALKNIIRR
jgi:hypothetical protein